MRRRFPEERAALKHLCWLLALIPIGVVSTWLINALPRWGLAILLTQAVAQSPFIIMATTPVARARKSRGKLIRSCGYRFCPDCNYDLRAIPDTQTCPECGATYPAKERELIWRDRYRFLEPRWYGDRANE